VPPSFCEFFFFVPPPLPVFLEAEWATSLNFGNANFKWNRECAVLDIESLVDLSFSIELWKVGKKKSNKIIHSVSLPSNSTSVFKILVLRGVFFTRAFLAIRYFSLLEFHF
jgi:hypothetical protein